MSQRTTLTTHVVSAVKKRMRVNLQLLVTDDITIKFTREELREYAETSRIENNTMAQIKHALRQEGWVVDGADNARAWIITVPVRKLMTEFDGLDELRERNSKHSGMLVGPKPPVRAALERN